MFRRLLRQDFFNNMPNINKNKNQRGFTIVETLVAVTILMISIAGPLTVANKGLLAAINAKDQMIASYLAQDAMEYVKNTKYLRVANNLSWNDGFSDCTVNTPCIVDSIESSPHGINRMTLDRCGVEPSSSSFCPVLFDDKSGYVQDKSSYTNAKPTIFNRVFYVSDCNNTITQCLLHVRVLWREGIVPYEVNLSSFISDKIF